VVNVGNNGDVTHVTSSGDSHDEISLRG